MRVAALAAATLSRHISSVYDGSDCPECSFTSRESEERVKASYGDNDERLATIKSKDDPTNFFRVNQNIKPAQEGESSMAIFQKKSFNTPDKRRTPLRVTMDMVSFDGMSVA
jgi:hypothetical protein